MGRVRNRGRGGDTHPVPPHPWTGTWRMSLVWYPSPIKPKILRPNQDRARGFFFFFLQTLVSGVVTCGVIFTCKVGGFAPGKLPKFLDSIQFHRSILITSIVICSFSIPRRKWELLASLVFHRYLQFFHFKIMLTTNLYHFLQIFQNLFSD